MKAVLLSRDLMFISRVKEVAAASGSEVAVVKNEAALVEVVRTLGTTERGVVLLDLEKSPVELEAVQRAMSGSSVGSWRCVCFFSHVHVEKAEDARSRGFGEVVPRSKFVQLLPGLLGA